MEQQNFDRNGLNQINNLDKLNERTKMPPIAKKCVFFSATLYIRMEQQNSDRNGLNQMNNLDKLN